MRTSRIGRAALALTATAALAAAAMTGAAAPSSARTLSAKPGEKLAYSVTRLSAPAGKVTLRMTNKDDIAHNVALRGKKLAKPHLGKVVGAGKVSTVAVTLPAGTYTFYCSVFGHEASGMRGTLTVTR